MGNPIACARAACAVFALRRRALVAAYTWHPALAQSINITRRHRHRHRERRNADRRRLGRPFARKGSAECRSDAAGSFIINNVPDRNLRAARGAPGYETISQRTVTVDATNNSTARDCDLSGDHQLADGHRHGARCPPARRFRRRRRQASRSARRARPQPALHR